MLPYKVLYCYFIMTTLKKSTFLFCLPLLTVFFSCSARIDGVVREAGSAEISIRTSLEPRTLNLIRSLRMFMGEGSGGQILNGESISRSMATAPGIRSVSLRNTNPQTLEGEISITHLDNFLSSGGNRFVSFTEGEANSSVVLVLDRNSAPALISRLSPEVEEYLSALMAPAALGESMTRQEYLDLVASVYGRPLADEIAAARIRAFVDFPRRLTAVRGGNAVGNRAEFDIPLVDILVLEQPLRYEAHW